MKTKHTNHNGCLGSLTSLTCSLTIPNYMLQKQLFYFEIKFIQVLVQPNHCNDFKFNFIIKQSSKWWNENLWKYEVDMWKSL